VNKEKSLLERFLLEISCAPARAPISRFFEGLRQNSTSTFLNGLQMLQPVTQSQGDKNKDCINGIMFGIAMVKASKDLEVQKHMEGFLEYRARERGEHVYDFLQEKAKRGR
jgi:hypothetical protein